MGRKFRSIVTRCFGSGLSKLHFYVSQTWSEFMSKAQFQNAIYKNFYLNLQNRFLNLKDRQDFFLSAENFAEC
jgi:hypothetical protein